MGKEVEIEGKSDWDDMEVIDDHFAGVSLDELQKLD